MWNGTGKVMENLITQRPISKLGEMELNLNEIGMEHLWRKLAKKSGME